MPFVKITRSAYNLLLTDHVSIATRTIFISKSFEKYFKSGHVIFYVDEENQLIGIKDDPDGNKFMQKKEKVMSLAVSFPPSKLKLFGIERGRYKAEWSKKHKMVIFTYRKVKEERLPGPPATPKKSEEKKIKGSKRVPGYAAAIAHNKEQKKQFGRR